MTESKIPSFWNTFHTMCSFPGGKIHFHSTSYYGRKWLEILENSLPAVIKIRENTVLVFQYIWRFWNQTSIVNSFLIISCKCSLVNKSPKFSLQVSVSSFNKVVLHVSFSELSLLLLFQGWQEQVPNSYTSAAKDRPNSDYDAGNNVMLFSVRKIFLAG